MGVFDFLKVKEFKQELEDLRTQNAALRQSLNESGTLDYHEIRAKAERNEEIEEKPVRIVGKVVELRRKF